MLGAMYSHLCQAADALGNSAATLCFGQPCCLGIPRAGDTGLVIMPSSLRWSHPLQRGCLLSRNDVSSGDSTSNEKKSCPGHRVFPLTPKAKCRQKLSALLQPLASHWLHSGPCRVLPPLSDSVSLKYYHF